MMTEINPECQFNAIYKNVEAQINLPSCFKNIFTVIILEYLSTIVDDIKPFSHKAAMRSLVQCAMYLCAVQCTGTPLKNVLDKHKI